MSKEEYEARIKLENTPFKELTNEQKIDRLVSYVRNFEYTSHRVGTLENRVRQLENHSHSENGSVVVPIRNNDLTGSASGSAKMHRHPLD